MIEFSLPWMRKLFYRHDVQPEEWVIFGSAVLFLHGMKSSQDVGDLDVFVSRRVWAALFADHAATGITVETPRAGDPPFLEYKIDTPIHFFYAWTPRDGEWMNAGECFARAETLHMPLDAVGRTYSDWRCVPLTLMREQKRVSVERNPGSERHEKHVRDLELIDRHLGRTA